jgi:hypothetical protein
MHKGIIVVLISLSFSLFAADKIVPPNIKTGLWEITENHNLTGMPPMPAIPPEALARMSPEQRAQFEAHMKDSFSGGPKTTTRKYCVTKEKLEKDRLFSDDNNKECTRTILNSSSTMTEVKIQCKEKDMTTDGTFKFEALSPENVRGAARMITVGNGRTMHMDFDFTSKYLGAACGDIK